MLQKAKRNLSALLKRHFWNIVERHVTAHHHVASSFLVGMEGF